MKKKKNQWKGKSKKVIGWVDRNQNIIVLACIFIFMFVLNCLTPYIADDINYRDIWGTTKRIHNIWDILVSQYNHYFTWGGRSIAHFIAQFFLMFPKMIFNIANSICYVGILSKINSIATNKKKNAWMILLIHVLLFLLVPYFGEDFLWLIGSCNYAWTIWFILILIDEYQKESKKESKLKIVGMFLLGIIAGWSNENTGLALVIFIALFLFYQKFMQKEKLRMWKITGLVGSTIGYLFLLLAPGNYVRSASIPQQGSFIMRVLKSSVHITEDALVYLFPLLVGIIVLYTYYIYKKKKPSTISFLSFIGAFVATYVMSASPNFPQRAWIGIVVFLTITMISLLDPLVEKERVLQFVLYDVIIVLSLISLRNYIHLAIELREYNYVIEERGKYIKENPNEKIYYFEKHKIDDRYSPIHGEDLTEDKDNWVNNSQAKRYGVPYLIGY